MTNVPIVGNSEVRDALNVLEHADWKIEAFAEKRRLKARANAIWLELYKVAPGKNNDMRQAWVEQQEQWIEASQLLGHAEATEHIVRGKMHAAQLKVEIWRSQEATHRDLNKRPHNQ